MRGLIAGCLLMMVANVAAEVERNIRYAPSERCVLDVKWPNGTTNFPTVVWFHGGGLTGGSKDFIRIDEKIAQVVANYRLLGENGLKDGAECIRDAAAAVAWTLENIAKYGGDQKKVYVSGMSAGGYLAMMVGMAPQYLKERGHDIGELAGLAPISGQATKHFNVRKFSGDADPQFLPKIDALAPLAYCAKDIPPIVSICGEEPWEWKCRSEENRLLISACTALGHDRAIFVSLPRCDHARAFTAGVPYVEMFVEGRMPATVTGAAAAVGGLLGQRLWVDIPNLTAELQARIDKLAEKGGTLVLEPGLYRTGALFFRPGVNLRLERGAVLQGVDEASEYPMRETRIEGETCVYYPALINADGCNGFTVSGEGVIDGHGLPTWKEFWALRKRKPDCTNKELMRPRLFYVSNSKNVEVSGVTFKNAKFWTTHYYRCSDLNIHDCHIVSETIGGVKGPSTDAIDLDNCRDVTIRRVRMDVNDDGVAIKGGKGPWADDPVKCPGNGPTVNVLIEDCDFGPGCHSCLTLGSECPAATNVVMRNCRVERAGNVLNLKMRADTPQRYHGICVENMTGRCHTVLNVRAWNQFFDLKGRKDPPRSYASDIRFADCDFTCSHKRNVVLTSGFEVSDVVFENVKTAGALAWPSDADTPERRRTAIEKAWHPNGEPFVQKEDGLRCTPMTDGTRAMRFLENGTDRTVTEIYEGYVSTMDPETGRIEATDEACLEPGKCLYVIGNNIWRYEGR